jgi:hypothetical protein
MRRFESREFRSGAMAQQRAVPSTAVVICPPKFLNIFQPAWTIRMAIVGPGHNNVAK